MPYCTQADILEQLDEDLLVQCTDDADAGAVDTSVVDRAIVDADAEIDSYCGSRYGVPFETVPAIIRKLSVDISIYHLFVRRLSVPEDRKERYNNAVRMLRGVSRGIVSLGAEAPSTDDDSGPETTVTKSDRIFSMGRTSDSSTGSLDNY